MSNRQYETIGHAIIKLSRLATNMGLSSSMCKTEDDLRRNLRWYSEEIFKISESLSLCKLSLITKGGAK